ncbi:hypothetical protein SARC_12987 [Sphaeroforma arctica JP610]|uniref:Uncharacterized protein n=1 Tax=Sphaeroforma arctica JP610 TaxID=667725 RepID=A0A0L0FEH5_9EUKA|nr:hypothetical protein SARC_12987 [Sphaeroforma arctica JP610]KNC74468.1 hypothetical protein SARC_12987 [Sphaeroforma arctica JP610]|eukprot:XP_014148370.1 hypothetical protein SARC_12987 [Sphaeroforma arctica JP610]
MQSTRERAHITMVSQSPLVQLKEAATSFNIRIKRRGGLMVYMLVFVIGVCVCIVSQSNADALGDGGKSGRDPQNADTGRIYSTSNRVRDTDSRGSIDKEEWGEYFKTFLSGSKAQDEFVMNGGEAEQEVVVEIPDNPFDVGTIHHKRQRGPGKAKPYDYDECVWEGYGEMEKSKAVIVGLVRNAGNSTVNRDITGRVQKLGEMFGTYKILVVENDSNDSTPQLLKDWRLRNEHVRIIASEFKFDTKIGKNVDHIRFKRMALIRNLYMLELATNSEYEDTDYVLVLDFDNKDGWDEDGIAHSFGLPKFYIPNEKTEKARASAASQGIVVESESDRANSLWDSMSNSDSHAPGSGGGQLSSTHPHPWLGTRDSGFPLEWDMVCANGRVKKQRGVKYSYTPSGGLPVTQLVQGVAGARAMESATRRMRVRPDHLQKIVDTMPNGTVEYIETVHALSSIANHYPFFVYVDELGDWKKLGVGALIKNLRHAMEVSGMTKYILEDIIDATPDAEMEGMFFVPEGGGVNSGAEDSGAGGADNADSVGDADAETGEKPGGVNGEVEVNKEVLDALRQLEEDKAKRTRVHNKKTTSTDTPQHKAAGDVIADATSAVHAEAAIRLAQMIMKRVHSHGRESSFANAISSLYLQAVRARAAAANTLQTNYWAVEGRFYDSLAFRDDVFHNGNFRAHQFVAHDPHDAPYYVGSCFGGLSIYRRESMKMCRYDSETKECEHHSIHKCMAEHGYNKFLFSPAMVVEY